MQSVERADTEAGLGGGFPSCARACPMRGGKAPLGAGGGGAGSASTGALLCTFLSFLARRQHRLSLHRRSGTGCKFPLQSSYHSPLAVFLSGDGARAGVPTRIAYNFKYNIAWHKPVTSGRTPATTSSRFAQFRVCLSARRQCQRHAILYGGSKGLVEYGIGAVQLHSRRQAGR